MSGQIDIAVSFYWIPFAIQRDLGRKYINSYSFIFNHNYLFMKHLLLIHNVRIILLVIFLRVPPSDSLK